MDDYVSGNWIAYAALLAWPLISIALFASFRLPTAIIWSVLGALLLLPAQVPIKIPMIPAIDKNSVATLGVLLGCTIFGRKQSQGSRLGLTEFFLVLYLAAPLVTSIMNGDTLYLGNRAIAGVGLYDGISALLSQVIMVFPFIIGRRYFRSAGECIAILRGLTFGGLLMTLPMLFEIRMSPQLANWIYGYFPSSFAVEMRNGGFRPVVFMNNGLSAAFFLSTAVLSACALWRARVRVLPLPRGALTLYLGGVLLLCKSAGALVYAVVMGPVIRWMSPKSQLRIALFLALVALLYPTLRLSGYFPTGALLSVAEDFNQERARSLKFRFDNEDKMLAHAEDRLFFGWGRYGRNRIYDETTGWESVTDGLWIITLGQFGLVGFIGQFGLFTLSVFRAAAALRYARAYHEQLLLSSLSIVVAVTAVEQLPNASVSPWTWLLTGALLGQAEGLRRSTRTAASSPAPTSHVTHLA